MLIVTPWRCRVPVKSSLVNWLTWGVTGQRAKSATLQYFCFGIRGLSQFDTTRLVSEHDQTHIRSPFATAAPISRLRRARLRKTRPFFKFGCSSHTGFRFVPPGSARTDRVLGDYGIWLGRIVRRP